MKVKVIQFEDLLWSFTMGCPAQIEIVTPEFSFPVLRHHEIFNFSATAIEFENPFWQISWFLCRLKAMEEDSISLFSMSDFYDTTSPYLSISGHLFDKSCRCLGILEFDLSDFESGGTVNAFFEPSYSERFDCWVESNAWYPTVELLYESLGSNFNPLLWTNAIDLYSQPEMTLLFGKDYSLLKALLLSQIYSNVLEYSDFQFDIRLLKERQTVHCGRNKGQWIYDIEYF